MPRKRFREGRSHFLPVNRRPGRQIAPMRASALSKPQNPRALVRENDLPVDQTKFHRARVRPTRGNAPRFVAALPREPPVMSVMRSETVSHARIQNRQRCANSQPRELPAYAQ